MDGDGGGAVEGLVEDEGCGEGGDCVKVQVEVEHPHGGLHCLGIASAAQTDAYGTLRCMAPSYQLLRNRQNRDFSTTGAAFNRGSRQAGQPGTCVNGRVEFQL